MSGAEPAARGRPTAPGSALVLGLETATAQASVALLRGDALLAERVVPEGVSAAEALLPALDAVLADAGVALAAVDGVALSIGPGSFTGLRIGAATVKGLLFERDVPVAPVPTLAALALAAPPGETPLIATLDAQRGDVYAAGYRDPLAGRADALAEGLYDLAGLLAALPAGGRLVGAALALHGPALTAAGVRLLPEAPRVPRAREVARIGARWLLAGQGVPAALLVPRYVRRAEAEARRTGQAQEPAPPRPDGAL